MTAEPMTVRARIEAPLPRVHRALVDPDDLSVWLADRVEVDLPGRWAFWGRYIPGGDEPRQRPEHVDDTSLRFSWEVGGVTTGVVITLAERDGATILTLAHSGLPDWREMMTDTGPLGQVHTFWSLAIANLNDHVTGRPLTPRVDLTAAEFRGTVEIAAARHEVFRALVDPARFARWFGARVDIEPEVGGRFAMGGFDNDPSPGRITEFEDDTRMTIRWPGFGVASWELAGSEGRTRMTIVQSGFAPGHPPYAAWMGWISGIAELRRFVELAHWRPLWEELTIEGMPEGLLTVGE